MPQNGSHLPLWGRSGKDEAQGHYFAYRQFFCQQEAHTALRKILAMRIQMPVTVSG
jgi:hypothetical protein